MEIDSLIGIKKSKNKYIKSKNNMSSKSNKLLKSKIERKIRYYIFDNLKGILIFCVVLGHFLESYLESNIYSNIRKIVIFIYFFHMEGFIFISGFLTSENSIKINNAIKLLILYYIFNYSYSLFFYFKFNFPINFIIPGFTYWYLLSLFSWRISIKFINKIEFLFILSILISLLEGYWECFSNAFSIIRTIGFFHYFVAGYKISKMNIINIFLIWRKGYKKYITFIILFLFFLYKINIYISHNQITTSTLLMDTYDSKNTLQKRIEIIIISYIIILFFFLFLPNKKLPLLSKWGKNSLYIYLFHSSLIIISRYYFFSQKKYSNYILEYSMIFTLIILFIFGSDFVTKSCNNILNFIHGNFFESNSKGKIIRLIFCLSLIFLFLLKPIYIFKKQKLLEIQKENIIKDLNDSMRISYIGSLMLLKDQIISAKNNYSQNYEFDEIFQYTASHFHESDFSIGIYESLSAGNYSNYTTSNMKEGIPLYLDYPDEFVEAVKKAGINLVITANNHLLDQKIEGVKRTIDIFDKYNLSHAGSYRNYEEKNKIEIFNIKGINIAVLAYVSEMNCYEMDNLYEKFKFLTRIIPKKSNKYYKDIYDDIKNDFIKVKKLSPDIIIIFSHIGKEFDNKNDEIQDEWNKLFSNLGANIILGQNSDSIQPLLYLGKTFIVNSPGNFVNSYTQNGGDSSAIIDIFIHKKSKKIVGANAIPMYIKEIKPKYFSPIPIYDLLKNKSISLNENERKRVEQIQIMSTKILLGKSFSFQEAKKNYYFINNSYYDLE